MTGNQPNETRSASTPENRMHESNIEQSFSLDADLAAARVLRLAVTALCAHAHADEMAIGDFALAVSEAFSNAVRHGVGTRQASIEARVEVSGEGARVCLSYPGEPFTLDEPRLPAPDATGGRGRFLMSVLTDRVHYHFERGMTQATLIKQWR